MAQVRAVDRIGTGDFEFAIALAKASFGESLVCLARVDSPRGNLRGGATALVSWLVSALFKAGILFQPARWPLRAGDIFYFHNHAARICVAAGGQRLVATQTPTRSEHSLASSQRLQSIGPALLKIKS